MLANFDDLLAAQGLVRLSLLGGGNFQVLETLKSGPIVSYENEHLMT